jgi:two-component system cell cycle sensor histidine kinase/response regulator CckA
MALKHKIMIVEDNYVVSKDIQEMLHELGYGISSTTDTGTEAVQLAGKGHPDIILMDIKLKGNMDGIEASKLIHEYYNIPVIYITGYADDYTLQRAKTTEPSGYILKPIKKEDLHTAIEMALYKHKVENFLRGREELLASTLKSISDGVVTTNEKGFITFMNPIAESMLNCSQEEVLGKSFDSAVNVREENTEKEIDSPVKNVIHEKKKTEYENHRLHFRNNPGIAISMAISPVTDDKGRISGTIVIIKDVTKQRRLQEELLKAQKLESLASLADTIGHEFNNLLTVIMGNIELIKQGGNIKGEALTDIEEAELAAQKAKDLAKKLLSFSKISDCVKKLASVGPIIKSTVQSITTTTQIHCDVSVPAFLWQSEIDETQVSHVIYSVIKKAYQLSETHGIVRISAENVPIEDSTKLPVEPGNYVKIDIREFDTSLPTREIKSVFDLRLTADGKLSENEIELATSYSIVKNHGGYISVDSAANEGTNFSIYLPAKESKLVDETRLPVQRNQTGKRRVLVMDDQQLVRIIAGKILNHFGFDVEFARHGGEAVEKYRTAIDTSNPFDCVILDLTVEFGIGGKEAIKKMIEIDPNVRAIVSTGYTNDPIKYNYSAYGFKGYIMKPYEFSEINKVVREVMNEG